MNEALDVVDARRILILMSSAADMTAVAAHFLAVANTVTGAGNWHGRKVFLSALFEALGAPQVMTFAEFGTVVVQLHQARLIRLSRADLVEAMPRALVQASEVAHLNATFHFVRID